MTTLRWGLLLTAAAILPSCGRHRDHQHVWVTVHNDGSVAADLRAEAEYWSFHGAWEEDRDLTVSADESVQFSFAFGNLSRLEVRIYRSTDQVKIFDESWDRDEIEDLDERVTITVMP
jgi:hypothetical protein